MDRDGLTRMLDAHGADAIVSALWPYLTENRRERIETVLGGRIASVDIAVEAPSDPHNAAAVVRTAEALGVLGVHVIAAEGRALHAKSTTQGAYHWVDTQHHDDLPGFLDAMHGQGRRIFGAAMEADRNLSDVPVDQPLCLLFGNEQRGLSPAARAAVDGCFRIPMYGMSESLNLSVSAAISLFDVLRRRRAICGTTDLQPAQVARLRGLYYLQSVDSRLAAGLLQGRSP